MRETAAKVSELDRNGATELGEPREELVKQLVRRQMNHSGNILLMGLEPLTDEEFFSGGPNGISPAWTVGHLACVLDLFTSWVARCKLQLPREVYAVFNPIWIAKREGTKAAAVDRKVFPKGEIMLMYRKAQVRALDALSDFDVGLWDVRPPDDVPDVLPTYGHVWQTLGAHTYWHLGELTGCIAKFHGTYTLNSAINYFYDVDPWQNG